MTLRPPKRASLPRANRSRWSTWPSEWRPTIDISSMMMCVTPSSVLTISATRSFFFFRFAIISSSLGSPAFPFWSRGIGTTDWYVRPPMLSAATPVGASTRHASPSSCLIARMRNVLPAPAVPQTSARSGCVTSSRFCLLAWVATASKTRRWPSLSAVRSTSAGGWTTRSSFEAPCCHWAESVISCAEYRSAERDTQSYCWSLIPSTACSNAGLTRYAAKSSCSVAAFSPASSTSSPSSKKMSSRKSSLQTSGARASMVANSWYAASQSPLCSVKLYSLNSASWANGRCFWSMMRQ